jgi:hypothetical protein
VIGALLAGGAFGLRHAFEADHVAAVATLVEDRERPATTGAAWGVGHSAPVVALGALALALDLRLPSAAAAGFEAVVALALVALGLRAMAGRGAVGIAVLERLRAHDHGDGGRETPDGEREREREGGGHRHLRIAGRAVGLTHSHADEESFAVGVVHGLAGSGGVVVALAAAAPTPVGGGAFLAGFVVASVGAMAGATWGWGRAVGRADRLRLVAGAASVAVGLALLGEVAGIALP